MATEEQAVASSKLTEEDMNTQIQRWREERDQCFQGLRDEARADLTAYRLWGKIKDEADWRAVTEKAREGYHTGRFFIKRLGAEHALYPEMLATLWNLRQQLVAEYQAGVAESMLIDLALVAFHNAFRVQSLIGNAATIIERELFGQESPTVKFKQTYGYRADGLQVEDVVQRLTEELMPLLDRCNRQFVRNLRAIRDLRAPAGPAVAIGAAAQVNVGTQQVNAVSTPTTIAEDGRNGVPASPRQRKHRHKLSDGE